MNKKNTALRILMNSQAVFFDNKEIINYYISVGGKSEHGVDRATRLADDLGLPGNPYSDIDKFTMKSAMHQALADNGVRSIREA